MQSLVPPITDYYSKMDIGKFNLIWKINIILVPIFFIRFSVHLYFENLTWIASIIACIISVVNLILLFSSRKFKLIGVLSVVIGVLMCQYLIFFVDDSHLMVEIMWSILISIYSFFILNSIYGTLVLLVNIFGIIIYCNYFNPNIYFIVSMDIETILNFIGVALIMSFIIQILINNISEINTKYESEIDRNKILLKEVHHRVKNNLQIISSLLKLQGASSKDDVLQCHFIEAINRVKSMALIHEKMYRTNELSGVNIEEYLRALLYDIADALSYSRKVELNVYSEIDKIDIKSMVPVSLIFNELITNSIKHGFSGCEGGVISVMIIRKSNYIQIEYYDSGVWKINIEDDSFGKELIEILTEQLDGVHHLEKNNGTLYKFEFPIDNIFPIN